MLRKFVILIGFVAFSIPAISQCAMCRVTLENNVSNGEAGIDTTINFGILYLFVMPYLAVLIIGTLWLYKTKGFGKSTLLGKIIPFKQNTRK